MTKKYQPAQDEFSALGKAVMDLLRSGDAARFATNLTATAQDWMSVASTNPLAKDENPLKGFERTADYERQKVESSAKAVLEKAMALHLDFAKGAWNPRVIISRHLGSVHFSSLRAGSDMLPWTERVEIILDPGATARSSANGDFKLSVRNLIKFPGGWRSGDGIQWETFPRNVGDEKTRRELALLSKVAANEGISGQDDPALLKFGEALVHFIRKRDPAIYEQDAYLTADLRWAQLERSGRKGPSRKEFDQEFNIRAKEQVDLARSTVQTMEDANVDLKNADIQIEEARVGRAQSLGAPGSIDGLMGDQFKLKLAVKSESKSKNGTPLSGEYILAANEIMRFKNDWKVMDNIHWYQLPDGILNQAVVARMKFENYVAEHRSLPPGMAAPEIEFTTLDGGKKMKLSDLKGKLVVLDFWATWCGPCQEPMADLQRIRNSHPDWKDRVAIVPISIDDTIDTVRKHVTKRGWTNTFNVWAGSGWKSAPPVAFRVTSVPTTYILDAQGMIKQAGHPAGLRIEEVVEQLLKAEK